MSSLIVTITSSEKGELYKLQIDPTQPDETKTIGSYAATYTGVGLDDPLGVKLRKFDRALGATKLTARVLGRLHRKHTDKLTTGPTIRTPSKTRTPRAKKIVKKVVKEIPAPVTATAPAPEPAPAPAREPVAMAAFQV